VRANGLTFNEDFAPAEDYKMWTQVVNFGGAIAVPRTLASIYEYSTGASSQNRERQLLAARRTRLDMLQELGFALNDEEALAHVFLTERISMTGPIDGAASLEEYSNAAWWLDEIQTRNTRLAAFDRRAFRRACAERFVSLTQCCARSYPVQTGRLAISTRSSRSIPSWLWLRSTAAARTAR
jgi:hypothetical protein